MHLTKISQSANHRCGALGPVLVVFWSDPPTVEAVLPRRPWLTRAVAQYDALGFLIVVEETAALRFPGPRFVEETRHQLDMIRHIPGFAALVVEGDGLMRSFARTFLRGQARFSGNDHRTKSFLSIDGAADWICDQLSADGPTSAELISAAAELRASRG